MNVLERILTKATSARFVFVIAVAVVYVWLSIKGTLPMDEVIEIMLLVLWGYFNRSDRTRARRKSDD